MAKGGGGAWKVAYADFVTAMMAFFLVMWICAQDQRIKQAIARYFVTPMGILETGSSTKPNRAGALFPASTSGTVPSSDAVSVGKGRSSYTPAAEVGSRATRSVSDWLHAAVETEPYWEAEVANALERARATEDLWGEHETLQEAAARNLATRLKSEVSQEVFSMQTELAQELLSQVLAEVNWTELAEDMLAAYGSRPSVRTSRRQAPRAGPAAGGSQ